MTNQVTSDPSSPLLYYPSTKEQESCSETLGECFLSMCYIGICMGVTTGISVAVVYGEQLNGIDSTLIKIASVVGVCLLTSISASIIYHGQKAGDANNDPDYGVA